MHRLAAALLVATLLIPGCLDDGPDGDAGPGAEGDPVAADLPLDLANPTTFQSTNLGRGAGEPNIAVGPDGTVYVSDPSIGIWRSDDGGRTFTKTAARGITGGGDGDIVIDVGSPGTELEFAL